MGLGVGSSYWQNPDNKCEWDDSERLNRKNDSPQSAF